MNDGEDDQEEEEVDEDDEEVDEDDDDGGDGERYLLLLRKMVPAEFRFYDCLDEDRGFEIVRISEEAFP
jgi:hypothetical protein